MIDCNEIIMMTQFELDIHVQDFGFYFIAVHNLMKQVIFYSFHFFLRNLGIKRKNVTDHRSEKIFI